MSRCDAAPKSTSLSAGPRLMRWLHGPMMIFRRRRISSSLRPLLEGAVEWEDTVYAEYLGQYDGQIVPWRMVEQGPWKYNYYHGLRPEMREFLPLPSVTVPIHLPLYITPPGAR